MANQIAKILAVFKTLQSYKHKRYVIKNYQYEKNDIAVLFRFIFPLSWLHERIVLSGR